jgi:hypothetical protein
MANNISFAKLSKHNNYVKIHKIESFWLQVFYISDAPFPTDGKMARYQSAYSRPNRPSGG